MRENKQGKRKTRRRLLLADTPRNTVLAAAVGGASTALVNGLVSLVAEAVRAVLEH